MAHAGLWALGGVSVGLVAAGLWLNSAEVPPAPAGPALASAAEPEPAPQETAAPESITEGAPPSEAPEPTAEPQLTVAPEPAVVDPPPAGLLSRVDGPGGIMWAHDALWVVRPEGAEAAPQALVDAVLPVDLSFGDNQTPGASGDTAVWRNDLAVYSGPPVWVFLPAASLSESARSALRSGLQDPQSLHYFGAVAMGAEVAPFYLAQGFATILAAEQAAMDTCMRAATGCRLVAQLTPEGFDGQRGDTLTHGQGLRWHAFHDLPLADLGVKPAFRAIALSEDGGVGTSDHMSADQARQEALDNCRKSRLRNRTGTEAQAACRIIAERASPGAGFGSIPVNGGLPETENHSRN